MSAFPERVYRLERDVERIDREVFGRDGLAHDVKRLETSVAVLAARIGIFATLGSVIGGGVVGAVAYAIFH